MVYDVAVIGGSYAGLSAAIYAARGRRSVVVVDAGQPRNRFSPAAHGFFGQDGQSPAAMIAAARSDLERYPAVEIVHGTASATSGNDGAFEISIDGQGTVSASKLVLATGIVDVLPDIAGLAERWGVSVLHCPYCHGYEHAGRRLGVLANGDAAFHHARLIANWGPTTLFLDPDSAVDGAALAAVEAAGIRVVRERLVALEGERAGLAYAETDRGTRVPLEALFVVPRLRLASPIPEQLGCEFVDTPAGRIVRVDGAMRTTVPGVYACGDIARAFGNAMLAAADGVIAGGSLNYATIFGEPVR